MLIVADRDVVASLKGVGVEIMTEAVDNGSVSKVICFSPGVNSIVLFIKANADVPGAELGAGNLQIQGNYDPTDPGGWAPLEDGGIDLATIDVPASEDSGMIKFDDMPPTFPALRCLIDEAVTGGSVSVVVYTS